MAERPTNTTTTTSSTSPSTLRTKLLGSWTLASLSCTALTDPTRQIPILGPRPRGNLTYTPSGHMTAILSNPDAPPLSSEHVLHTGVEERAAAFLSALAYCGRFWAVDDAEGEKEREQGRGRAYVVHRIEMATIPNWNGTVQRRWVEWEGQGQGEGEGEVLVLRPPVGTKGSLDMELVLKFKRVEENGEEMPREEELV